MRASSTVVARGWLPIGLLALLTIVLAGCNGAAGASTAGGGANGQAAAVRGGQRLWIKQGDERLPLGTGRTVTVDGLTVEISARPQTLGRATLDLNVLRDGAPVDGASILLRYDMTEMEHGPFELLAVQLGRGHYVAPVEPPMAGPFWLDVTVRTSEGQSAIHMVGEATR
jgi:hypothetical protein